MAKLRLSAYLYILHSALLECTFSIRKANNIEELSSMRILPGSNVQAIFQKHPHFLPEFFIITECECLFSSRFSSSFKDASAFAGPKANIYSLVSRTSRKFFFPDFFSRLTKLPDDLLFAHLVKRGRVFCNHLSESLKMFLCTFWIRSFCFHNSSPLFQEYYLVKEMSR